MMTYKEFLHNEKSSRFAILYFAEKKIHIVNPLTQKWICDRSRKIAYEHKTTKIGIYEFVNYFIEQFEEAKNSINHDSFWEDMDRNLSDKNLMIEESFKNFAEDYFAEDFLDEKYTLCEKCMGKFLDNIFYNSKTKLGKSLSNLDRLF